MALQPDIQYVPFYYVDGSAARKVTQKKSAQTVSAPVPAPKRRQSKLFHTSLLTSSFGVICSITFA